MQFDSAALRSVIQSFQNPGGESQEHVTYTPFSYGDHPPLPIDPVQHPTPAQRREMEARAQRQQQLEKDAMVEREVAERSMDGGFLSKAASLSVDLSNRAQKGIMAAVTNVQTQASRLVDDYSHKRFLAAFPNFAQQPLLGDFKCKVLSSDLSVPRHTLSGFLDITDQRVCFVGDANLNFSFLLSDVVSIACAIGLQTEVDGRMGQVHVIPLPHPSVVPNIIEVYTAEKMLHRFMVVNDGYKDALSVLDHAWRNAVSVPVDGITYVASSVKKTPTPTSSPLLAEEK
eukprot:NODE_2202_length_1263_cov_52.169687_g2003_i0.p1 GENE.NODE_2202_length_1263_cov_52.169687_g2003_i0~~NODE_2202_length_1263_cov_52.169687_g2003_i0.p1  ORF type:complete len:286 (-),score=68.43 NODE_2202_length_1263_cov_52.169687_g2003_i0:333-1190(-)